MGIVAYVATIHIPGWIPPIDWLIDWVVTGAGQYYAVNIPLKDGIDDATYYDLFRPVIDRIMQAYQPEAVVFQCGDYLSSSNDQIFGCYFADCVCDCVTVYVCAYL